MHWTQAVTKFITAGLIFALSFSSCGGESGSGGLTDSTDSSGQTVVDDWGRLQILDGQLCSEAGEAVALHGMSLFWSQWAPDYYNDSCITWLTEDWKINVIRAAIAADAGGYLTQPQLELANLDRVVKSAETNGIYVLIDWHSHHAEDYTAASADFFRAAAARYGHLPNVIYEIYNEPLDLNWSAELKPYHETVIRAIREKDPDNLILAGTPNWSQDLDAAAADPLNDPNLAYVMHFYAGTHGADLRSKTQTALDAGLAVFVSEWGVTEADAGGGVFYPQTQTWMDFCDERNLSWCNWSVNEKLESTSILKPGASVKGGWTDAELTEAGRYVRALIRARNSD